MSGSRVATWGCIILSVAFLFVSARTEAQERIQDGPRRQISEIDNTVPYQTELARVHVRFDHPEKALPLLKMTEKKCKTKRDKYELYSVFVECYRKMKDFEKCVEFLEKQLATVPQPEFQGRVLSQLVPILIEVGKLDLATERNARLAALAEKRWKDEANYFNIKIHEAKGDVDQYIGTLEERLKKEAKNVDLITALIQAYSTQKGRPEVNAKILPLLKTLVTLDPDNDSHKYRLADLYGSANRPQEASNIYKSMLSKDERRNGFIIRRIIDINISANESETAVKWIQKLEGIVPEPQAAKEQARAYSRLGLHEMALKSLHKALRKTETAAGKAQIYFEIVEIYMNEKRYKEAEQKLKELIADDSLKSDVRSHAKRLLFNVLDKAGRLDEIDIVTPKTK